MSKKKKLSRGQLAAAYKRLYDQVPQLDCKGLCHDTCTEFPLPRAERRLVEAETRVLLPSDPKPKDYDGPRRACPLLAEDKTCGGYEHRPLICRLWGAADNMPCNYGCQPLPGQKRLTARKFYELMIAAYELSGDSSQLTELRRTESIPDELVEAMAPVIAAYAAGRMTREETAVAGHMIRQRMGYVRSQA